MFEQLTENKRVNLRGDHAAGIRQTLIDRVGLRRFLIWQLRTVDHWTIREIVHALTMKTRTVERHIRTVKTAAEQLRDES